MKINFMKFYFVIIVLVTLVSSILIYKFDGSDLSLVVTLIILALNSIALIVISLDDYKGYD